MAEERRGRATQRRGVIAPYPSRRASTDLQASDANEWHSKFPPATTRTAPSPSPYGRDYEAQNVNRLSVEPSEKQGGPPAAGVSPGRGGPPSGKEGDGPPPWAAGGTGGPPPWAKPGEGPPGGGPPGNFKERSKGRVLLIMFALGMAVFLAALDITIITTALPTISAYFNSAAGYTWIGSAYLLATAASTPIWGKISDIFGRKPMLLIANVIFFAGSLIAALSINIGMLITARVIQGIGGGGLTALVNITIGDLFSPRRRGAYYGIIGGVWAIASSVGPVLGGVFTTKVSWRWCFYINLPLDGLAFVIIVVFLDLTTPKTPFLAGLKAIDWVGAFLIVSGTLLLLFGLEYGGVTFPWDSATVLSLVIIGAVLIVSFFFAERYLAKNPIMPPRIFYKSTNIASLLVCFLQSYVFISGSYYLPLYFQAVKGVTPLLSGVYLLATTLALSVGSIATGIFIRKTGNFLIPIFVGTVLMTVGFGLYIDLDANASFAKIIPFQIVAGLGVGPLFQAPLISLQSAISPRDIGTATAAFGFTRNLGTAISVVVGSVVFNNEIGKQATYLQANLPTGIASALANGEVGSSVGIIDALPPVQREVARVAFTTSLRPAWIMYTAFAGLSIVAACFIGTQKLSKQHTETKTGLVAEKEAQAERKEEDRVRKEMKAERSRSRSAYGVRPGTGSSSTIGNGSIAARSWSRVRSIHDRPTSSHTMSTIGFGREQDHGASRPGTAATDATSAPGGKSSPDNQAESNASTEKLNTSHITFSGNAGTPSREGSQNRASTHEAGVPSRPVSGVPSDLTSDHIYTDLSSERMNHFSNFSSDRLYSDLSADRTYSNLGAESAAAGRTYSGLTAGGRPYSARSSQRLSELSGKTLDKDG